MTPVSGTAAYDTPRSAGTSAARRPHTPARSEGSAEPPAAVISRASTSRSSNAPTGPATALAKRCRRNCWLTIVPAFSKTVSVGITTAAATLEAQTCVPRWMIETLANWVAERPAAMRSSPTETTVRTSPRSIAAPSSSR